MKAVELVKTDIRRYTDSELIGAFVLFKLKIDEAAGTMKEKEYKEYVSKEFYNLIRLLDIAPFEIKDFIDEERKAYSFIGHVERKVKAMLGKESL